MSEKENCPGGGTPSRAAGAVAAVLALLRPAHWLKNLLVFAPVFFVGAAFDAVAVGRGCAAWAAFSLAASAVYVINDWFDRDRDRRHPVKCRRPIAAGRIGGLGALLLTAACLTGAVAFTGFAHAYAATLITVGGYVAMNVAYAAWLKNTPLADIFTLAAGFVFRVFCGAFFTGFAVSAWLFLCIFSAALYFACGKRRNELRRLGAEASTRPVLARYSQRFLDMHYYMFCGLSIIFYCLWTVVRSEQPQIGKLALTVPILIFLFVRYNFTVESEHSDGDPVRVLLGDRWLMAASIAFCLVNFVVLYFGPRMPAVQY